MRFLAGYVAGSAVAAIVAAWVLARYARWRDKVDRGTPR